MKHDKSREYSIFKEAMAIRGLCHAVTGTF
jgi:hypothetical protein